MTRRTFLHTFALSIPFVGRAAPSPATPAPGSIGIPLLPPTGRTNLTGSDPSTFMHTGSGDPRSGMYGNTRKNSAGNPRFHEGIDIAPLHTDPKTRLSLDTIHTIAPGTIAYINRHHKTPSLYGNYIIVLHTDPAFGTYYSLYAHLRTLHPGIAPGQIHPARTPLGTMGNIPDIPAARSHLHLEIGIILSTHYHLIDSDHNGTWNGANLYGFDPSHIYATLDPNGHFHIAPYLQSLPAAFTLTLHLSRIPDYFRRHPTLWRGPRIPGPAAITFTCQGIPQHGRSIAEAPPEPTVLACDLPALRKGRPYIQQTRPGHYMLTPRGKTLLENLLVDETSAPSTAPAPTEIA